jgi:protein TonB
MKQKLILIIGSKILIVISIIFLISCDRNIYQKEEVDAIASFPNGQDSLINFLDRNKKWVSNQASGQGYIIVSFIVDKKGRKRDIKVVKSMFFIPFESEAIRLVKLMPNWIPAKKNIKNVNSKVELQIKFKLEE